MAFPPFVTDAVVLADIAASIKQWDGTVVAPADAPFWTPIVSLQHQSATNLIYLRLVTRGYLPATIALWDLGSEVERRVALYQSLEAGGALESVDDKLLADYKTYTDIDPEKSWFARVLVTAGGVWKAPDDTPGTARAGASYDGSLGTTPPTRWTQGAYGWRW